MVLFVREGCDFCKDLPGVKGLVTFKVENMNGRSLVVVGENRVPLSKEVKGLPALIVGADIFIGKGPILKKLEELAHAPA